MKFVGMNLMPHDIYNAETVKTNQESIFSIGFFFVVVVVEIFTQ